MGSLVLLATSPLDSAHASTLHRAPAIPSLSLQAWLYPAPKGDPECLAASAVSLPGLSTGALKVEYMDVGANGVLYVNRASDPANACNGYSLANAAYLRAHSAQQYVTVSLGSLAAERALTGSPTRTAAAVATLTSFVTSIGFTGVDIDFENYWSWVGNDALHYFSFLHVLAQALHADGLLLQVDGPGDLSTPFNYGKVLALGVDQVVMMDYDYQDPSPVGATCPSITPLGWLRTMVHAALDQIPLTQRNQLVIGLPNYGYVAAQRCQSINGNIFFDQTRHEPGFSSNPATINARRSASSGEIRWSSHGRFYDYVDQYALDQKLAILRAAGVTHVSVWVLGGANPWFAANLIG